MKGWRKDCLIEVYSKFQFVGVMPDCDSVCLVIKTGTGSITLHIPPDIAEKLAVDIAQCVSGIKKQQLDFISTSEFGKKPKIW
jgi:hypothetical protein